MRCSVPYLIGRLRSDPSTAGDLPIWQIDGTGELVPLQQVPEFADRGFVRQGIVGQLQPGKAPHRLTVVQAIFGLWVGQVEPLLHEVDPEHHRQRLGRMPVLAFGIVRLDQADDSRRLTMRRQGVTVKRY